MKAYGLKRKHAACCPAHDKNGKGLKNIAKTDRDKATNSAKKSERQRAKREIKEI